MDERDIAEQAYKNGYEKGKADALKWIPVAERLPENGTQVLVAYSSGDIKTGVSFSGFLALSYGPDAWADATHWMPLPAPPKEVE